jgi:hypothetical protein
MAVKIGMPLSPGGTDPVPPMSGPLGPMAESAKFIGPNGPDKSGPPGQIED